MMGMSKKQKNTNDGASGTSDIEMNQLRRVKTSDDMKGVMLTTTNPPNMNIVDLSDTISDVEDINTEQIRSGKHTRKRKRRAVNQSKDKAAGQAEVNEVYSDEELFHKEPNKIDSPQTANT